MASHEIYNRVHLDLGVRCIRLVEIMSSSDPANISLKFHTYTLQNCPPYYALSYTWGDAANPKRILINGTEFSIRENLWTFLHQQTYLQRTQLIWIDALCIDQGNIHERNHQVGMMAEIFSQVGLSFWFLAFFPMLA
jgi:hypothetical protein